LSKIALLTAFDLNFSLCIVSECHSPSEQVDRRDGWRTSILPIICFWPQTCESLSLSMGDSADAVSSGSGTTAAGIKQENGSYLYAQHYKDQYSGQYGN
jgi:hypothetical protein